MCPSAAATLISRRKSRRSKPQKNDMMPSPTKISRAKPKNHEADNNNNTLRSLTAVGTAQLARPLKIAQNERCSIYKKPSGKSQYREGRKASATAQPTTAHGQTDRHDLSMVRA